jgi:nucleoside-diphosphate-sugar epimerase
VRDMHVLIAGCGWLGCAVAQQLIARGDQVTGVRTDLGRAEALRPFGIQPLALDLADPATISRIPEDIDALLALQASTGEGEPAYRRAYLEANLTLLAVARRQPLRAFIYTGSTGVFGQRDGSDVDEGTPPAPATATGAVLVDAERLLLEAAEEGLPTRIVRLSGLYGPGRTWIIDRVRRGLMPGDAVWMNSCHQEDAVQTVLATLDRGRNGAVYHGTDAMPMRRQAVVAFLAERLGITPAVRDSGPDSRGANRRILGERTRRELGIQLHWPSLREGLAPFVPALKASQEVPS